MNIFVLDKWERDGVVEMDGFEMQINDKGRARYVKGDLEYPVGSAAFESRSAAETKMQAKIDGRIKSLNKQIDKLKAMKNTESLFD